MFRILSGLGLVALVAISAFPPQVRAQDLAAPAAAPAYLPGTTVFLAPGPLPSGPTSTLIPWQPAYGYVVPVADIRPDANSATGCGDPNCSECGRRGSHEPSNGYWYHGRWYYYDGANGASGLPAGRRYFRGRYYGNLYNRYYGPQYGYF
jgi:hypothetical protein